MNGPVPVSPLGHPPLTGNLFVIFWTLLNFLIPLVIVLLIIWYVKKNNDHKKQLMEKVDQLIALVQNRQDKDK